MKQHEWKRRAVEHFGSLEAEQRVFTREQIGRLLNERRPELGIPKTLSVERFLGVLFAEGRMRKVKIPPEAVSEQESTSANPPRPQDRGYRAFERYVWGEASPYEVALSLRGGSYLSHASAALLHGLADDDPDTIYTNKEQSAKPPPRGPLTQEGIDRAFANHPRSSNYVFRYEGKRIVLLNGKQSQNLGVEPVVVPFGPPLLATGLERTLIDLTVRPAYAGGVMGVLAAYRHARGKVSVDALLTILGKLQFVYPYHQAVGLYLKLADYSGPELQKLRTAPRRFDFYLAHHMDNPDFDPEWRVYYAGELRRKTK